MSCALLADLSVKKAISEEIIQNIRKYIVSKYSSSSSQERAAVFYDAINRIIDKHLPDIDLEQKEKLKNQIFKETSTKNPFFIDYSDIFKATLNLKLCGNVFFHGITQWLSQSLDTELDRTNVYTFYHNVYKMQELYKEKDMGFVIEKVEDKYGYLFDDKSAGSDLSLSVDNITSKSEQASGPALSIPLSTEAVEVNAGSIPDIESNTIFKSAFSKLQHLKFADIIPGYRSLKAEVLQPQKLYRRYAATAFSIICLSSTIVLGATNLNSVDIKKTNNPSNILPVTAEAGAGINGSGDSSNAQPLNMKATAYDLSIKSCGKPRSHPYYGITATGTRAAVGRTIAVDSSVIPLGTSVYVSFPEQYNYLDGVYIAEDTGNSIKGNKIDVFFGEDPVGSYNVYNKAMDFGIQDVTVKILDNKPD